MLSGAITPSAKSALKDGSTYTFTIVDSFQSMVTLVKDISDFKPTIERVRVMHNNFKQFPVQPYVIVVGASYETISEFYCVNDGLTYKCQSFLHALDLCFKLFFVLRLEYPSPCYFVWVFLEKIMYEMSATKKTSSKVSILYNQFK
jgi:hypothetical protein